MDGTVDEQLEARIAADSLQLAHRKLIKCEIHRHRFTFPRKNLSAVVPFRSFLFYGGHRAVAAPSA
jgi:hypothetical protein